MDSTNGIISSESHEKKPLFSFGVISDVQYADIPNGSSFHGVPRYYRHSINVLRRAVNTWNDNSGLNFALNFGDIVDGYCPRDKSLTTVEKILGEFNKFNGPVHHLIGNHCLYNLPRDKLIPLLRIPSRRANYSYFDFSPVPEFRIVVLDPYDISAIGWPDDHPKTLTAVKLLQLKNPNADKNRTDGLVGLEKRFVKFNGGLGRQQLDWLDEVLRDSTERTNQSVIICCHLPLDPIAASPEALPWNYDEVMEVVHRYSCVKACFSGHDHKGGYGLDSRGVHHRILEAALECPPGSDSFGHVEVYRDKLLLVGVGRMMSTEMIFGS